MLELDLQLLSPNAKVLWAPQSEIKDSELLEEMSVESVRDEQLDISVLLDDIFVKSISVKLVGVPGSKLE